jgi:hypothetical protein
MADRKMSQDPEFRLLSQELQISRMFHHVMKLILALAELTEEDVQFSNWTPIQIHYLQDFEDRRIKNDGLKKNASTLSFDSLQKVRIKFVIIFYSNIFLNI